MLSTTVPRIIPDDSARTRRTDPISSHEAADTNDTAASSREVLWLLKSSGPMADHELIAVTGARVVSQKRYTPSRDLSDATIPITSNPPSEYADLCRALVAKKAAEDAEHLLAMLGLTVAS